MPQSQETSREKPLILMVDDVPKNLQVLGSILGANQYLITPAMSGEQALARVEQLMPDLILLDVMMPGIDGFETCRRLKANPKTQEIPVIFLTAKTETVDVVQGFNVGAVDYVTKPFQAEELLTRVATQMSLRQKTIDLKALNAELKQSEEKYRGLFDSSVDAILSIDTDFCIKDANPGAKKLLSDSLDNQSLTEFIGIAHLNKIKTIIENQVQIIGYSDAFESELTQNNSKTSVEIRLWRSDESDNSFWMLIRDISERKEMEQLREDVDRIMRHDLKNPLSGIIGLSDMLKLMGDNFSEDHKSWIKQINQSGRQALDMIDHSLDIFKMEQGTYAFFPEPCNLIPILKKIETNFYQLRCAKKITIQFFIHDAPINDSDIYAVLGVKRLLESLLANLIKNAIEASPDNESVSVNLIKNSDNHNIVIHNQGCIPQDLQKRFFEKYATSGKKHGTGLGTYSAKLIAKTHGGDITFQSNEQEGTSLIVIFPKSDHDTIQQATPKLNHQKQPKRPELKKQIRVLVADDSPNNMLMIGHYLEPFPCVLDLAENGQICVDYFKAGQYDLVMIDLQMPVLDGIETVQKIRSFEKENACTPTPIVALSADTEEDVRQASISAGCNDFMPKPVTEKSVQDIILLYCKEC